MKIKQSYFLILLLIFTSLNSFGLSSGNFEITSTDSHKPSLFSTVEEDKSKGVLPENTPVSPTENTEKEERENEENKNESFKCVFGVNQSAKQNHFEITNKCATQLNFRHTYYSPLYILLHSWKAFLNY